MSSRSTATWRESLQDDPRAADGLRVHVEDALHTDFVRLRADGGPLRIVGNLPYNISTPLLFRLLSQRAAIADMHFMLQKEVVDRMTAQPSNKTYGRLTVMLAAVAEVEKLFDVGPGAFTAAAQSLVGHCPLAANASAPLRYRR